MTISPELSELLQLLVSIDSINPSLVPGARGEGELAQSIANWFREQGIEVHIEETAEPGRPNIVAVVRGSGGGRSLLLNGHMDTVGVSGVEQPFTPTIKDYRLYGRGALDTKGGLASLMQAAAHAKGLNLRGDVILAAVADEEYASFGTEALVKRWTADAAIVTEPTALDLVIAHKGFVWLEVETFGIAAHGSTPEYGVDAIMMMGKVLVELEKLGQELLQLPPHPLLGTGTLHASLIEGGQELSSYPAHCKLRVERRTIPGETTALVEAEIQHILSTLSSTDYSFQASFRTMFTREPLEVSPNSQIVEMLRRNTQKVLGYEPPLGGSSGWMDSALLSQAGIPTVVFGPDGEGLHSAVEWVDLDTVQVCYDSVLATILEFCG